MLSAVFNRFEKAVDRWMFRSRGVEPGEVFLSQRRVYIVPTRPGLMLGVTLAALFTGAINYNLNLGFALTFVLGACALVDMYLTFRNLAHLHLRAGRVQPVFAGQDANFELHLINRRKYDRYAIWLGAIGPHQTGIEQAADIGANDSGSVHITSKTAQRGWMTAPRIRLQTRFPLGLLRAWSYWQPDSKALVYPFPEAISTPLPMQGENQQERPGQAGHDDFAGIRGYQSGDALRHLAWRQIARLDLDMGGQLVTKHFEGGAGGEICLDYAELPGDMNVELKLSRMTRWVLDAEQMGLPYAFRLGATVFAPAVGPAQQLACLQALALFEGTQ
ncbi:MAG: DUF58 domain-containing protein [Pseudomonadota bacterium]